MTYEFASLEFETYHKKFVGETFTGYSTDKDSAQLNVKAGGRLVYLPLTKAWAVISPPDGKGE